MIWLLAILSVGISGPALTAVLKTGELETSFTSIFKAGLVVTVASFNESWKISLSLIFEATKELFTHKWLVWLWFNYLDLENTVSPSSSAHSTCVFLTWHVALAVWLLAVLSKSISSPAFTTVLETSVLEAHLSSILKAGSIVTITSLDESWKISLSTIYEASLVFFSHEGFIRLWLDSLNLEDTVSPSSTAHSSCIFLTWHVALVVWLLAILSVSITSPALTAVLKTGELETSFTSSFKAGLVVTVASFDESWKISLSLIFEAAQVFFSHEWFILWCSDNFDFEDAVSPSSSAHSSGVFLAWHVALSIWLLAVLSVSITSPALTAVLETSIFESRFSSSFKAGFVVTITGFEESWKISLALIFEASKVFLSHEWLVYWRGWL